MSFRPVRKIVGIGNVFLVTELVDIAEYDLEIYEENPEDHEHHGANWAPGSKKIEGTVVGELPIRKDLRLLTEEGYSVKFYLRDSFGSVVILDPCLIAMEIQCVKPGAYPQVGPYNKPGR